MENIPKPTERQDFYYNYLINGGDIDKLPVPIDRTDHYLYYLCVNGFGGGGEDGGVTPEMLDAAVAAVLASGEDYTDTKIADLIGGAPETLDTLKEVADAIAENETVVEALNDAIGNKLNKDGDASNTTATFTQATTRTNIATGEKFSVILGKIKKWFADLKTIAFTGSCDDLTGILPIAKGGTGNNTGTADRANKDGNGKVISETYLPKSGGDVTGNIKGIARNGTKPTIEGFINECAYVYGTIAEDGDYQMDFVEGNLVFKNNDDESNVMLGVDGVQLRTGNYKSIEFATKTFNGEENRIVLSGYQSVNPNSFYGYAHYSNKAQTLSLGNSGNKWSQVYATNGTIQTSDRNEKNTVKELSVEQAKSLILGLKPSTYKMNSGTSNRTHWGMISQDIEELLEELGWDSKDFAGFIKSLHYDVEWIDEEYEIINKDGTTETKTRKKRIETLAPGKFDYSLRYDEFIAPHIKVTQNHEDRLIVCENTIQEQKIEIESLKETVQEQNETIQSLLARLEAVEQHLNLA